MWVEWGPRKQSIRMASLSIFSWLRRCTTRGKTWNNPKPDQKGSGGPWRSLVTSSVLASSNARSPERSVLVASDARIPPFFMGTRRILLTKPMSSWASPGGTTTGSPSAGDVHRGQTEPEAGQAGALGQTARRSSVYMLSSAEVVRVLCCICSLRHSMTMCCW